MQHLGRPVLWGVLMLRKTLVPEDVSSNKTLPLQPLNLKMQTAEKKVTTNT